MKFSHCGYRSAANFNQRNTLIVYGNNSNVVNQLIVDAVSRQLREWVLDACIVSDNCRSVKMLIMLLHSNYAQPVQAMHRARHL